MGVKEATGHAAGGEHAARLWRIILVLGLGGWLLGLGLTGWCWWEFRQADQAYEAIWNQALDLDGSGASLFRLRLDPKNPHRYNFTPLPGTPLDWPKGPLPEAQNYKVKALAGLNIEAPQKLFFRVFGHDGVSIYIQGEAVFEQWRPFPLTIDARFSQEVPAGRLLLEVDYLKVNPQSGLSVEIRDEAGRPVSLLPLKPEVDVPAWLGKRTQRDNWDRRTGYALMLALALGLVPLAWSVIRDPHWVTELGGSLARLAPGFWCGFLPVMLWQMTRLLSSQDVDDLLLMLGIPLLGGLIGTLSQVLITRLLGPERLAAWWRAYLAREGLWLPALAFLLFVAYVCWAMTCLGAYLPYTFLEAPWDAQQYKDIALDWYKLQRTETGGIAGNYPWHMLLPLLGRGWHKLGVDIDWSMLLVVWPAAAAVFFLVFRLARQLFGAPAARWTLAALVCYPCSWYLLIGYPYSLALALSLGYFLAVRSRRLAWALALGYLLGLTYPTALLAAILPLFLLTPVIRAAEDPWPPLRDLVLVSLAPALGLLTFCFNHWYLFNEFWLPVTGHEMWGRHPAWPWSALVDGILHDPPQYPEAIAMFLVVGGMVIFAHRFHPALWALLLITVAAGPSTGSLEAVYRQNVMAWPLYLLIGSSRRSPWLKLAWLWLSVYFALKWFMPLWLAKELV